MFWLIFILFYPDPAGAIVYTSSDIKVVLYWRRWIFALCKFQLWPYTCEVLVLCVVWAPHELKINMSHLEMLSMTSVQLLPRCVPTAKKIPCINLCGGQHFSGLKRVKENFSSKADINASECDLSAGTPSPVIPTIATLEIPRQWINHWDARKVKGNGAMFLKSQAQMRKWVLAWLFVRLWLF